MMVFGMKLTLLAGLSTLALAAPAMAQTAAVEPDSAPAQPGQAAATPNPDTPSATGIADIVVTANRTQTLASKTPITLTAVTGAVLQSQGISNPTQLMQAVPSVTIDRGNANGLQINIRGIDSTGTSAPSAAFLVDGIYIAEPNAQEVSFYDLDRVEVLRGPQGTLYGRNTTAGVVNLISAAPKFAFGASLDTLYGNYGARQVTGSLNIPVNEAIAIRFAGNYDARDSYYHQTVAQAFTQPRDKDNASGRVSVLVKPNDAIRLLVKVDYSSLRGAGTGFGSNPLISNFYQTPLIVPPAGVREPDPVYLDPSASQALAKTYADAQQFRVRDNTLGVTEELNWNFAPSWELTYLGAYREFNRNDVGSVFWGSSYATGQRVDTVMTSSTTQRSQSQSHEGRIAFDNGALKAQAGVYYFKQHSTSTLQFGNFGLPTPLTAQTSFGLFGQSTYALTDRWRVTGGVRYTEDKRHTIGRSELYLPFGTLVLNSTDVRGQNEKVTWKVETDYDLTPSIFGYATIATGYKAGASNANCLATNTPCDVKPENVTNYEAGLKARLMGNTVLLNAAAFHYDYTDLQISQIVPQVIGGVTTPSSVTTNAAAAKVDGVELEGSWVPTQHDRVDFTAAWLNARYTDYLIAPTNPQSGSYAGAPLNHSPKWAFSAGYTHTQPLGNGSNLVASLRSRYRAKDFIINTVANTFFQQPAYTKTDANLRYEAPEARWYLEGFVRNIENTVDVTYINTAPNWPTLNNGTVSTGDPRTYGGRIGFRF